ncbi:MAG: sugar phosphate isomerase/epimerase family protein [Gemmataceae bacterium]
MRKFKLGVALESFAMRFRRAIEKASELEFDGVQVPGVGDLSPQELGETGRREFRNVLKSKNLDVASVSCVTRRGLSDPQNLEPRIEYVKSVMQLAYDLGGPIATIQAGQVPADEDDLEYKMLKETLTTLGEYGDRVGTTLALETGLESGATLAKLLDSIDTGSLGVYFDPANLTANSFRPFEAVQALAGRIVQVQARDARRSSPNRMAQIVPLGHGEVDWMGLVAELEGTDYHGWIVLKCENKDRSLGPIEEGLGFLRRFVG